MMVAVCREGCCQVDLKKTIKPSGFSIIDRSKSFDASDYFPTAREGLQTENAVVPRVMSRYEKKLIFQDKDGFSNRNLQCFFPQTLAPHTWSLPWRK